MLDWMFIMFFILAIVMLLIAIANEGHDYWNISASFISATLWLILALSQMELEIPWQMMNTSSNAIETGYHTFSSPISPYLVYFFVLMFWICFIYFLAMIWDKWYNYKNWHGGK